MQTPNSAKLRAQLPVWYKELHEGGKFAGTTWMKHVGNLCGFIDGPMATAVKTILDFGCGPKGGMAVEGGLQEVLGQDFTPKVRAYDPYVAAYKTPPWDDGPYDLVFSADVLEHLLLEEIAEFTIRLHRLRPKFIFLAVATRPATKFFPNGANVHLTVEPADWWRGYFQGRLPGYRLTHSIMDMADRDVTLGLKRI